MRNTVEFLALAAIWGASFLLMRTAAPPLGPVPLMLLRCAIGAATLLPVLLWHGGARELGRHLLPIAAVGVINSAIPFVLLAFATLTLTAGVTSILNSLAPLWAAVVAFLWFGDRLNRWQMAGLALGIAGVVLLMNAGMNRASGQAVGSIADIVTAFAAGVLATVAYGIGANLVRSRLKGVPPLAIATGSQLSAALVLLLPGVFLWPQDANLTGTLLWEVIALGAVCTGFAYLLFFRLISNLGATRTITVTFVIPVFGVAWGAMFLGERIHVGSLLGAVVIVLGTALATGVLRPRDPLHNPV